MVVPADLLVSLDHWPSTETVGVTVTREDEEMTAAAAAARDSETGAPAMGALSRLVQEVNDSGVTYQEMADRGIDPDGNKLPRQWYQKLVKTPPVNPPSVPQLQALHLALGVPLRRVQEAAAEQWLQYEATELAGYDAEVRIIVGHLAGMSRAELVRWRYMIEAEERARREAGE